MSQPDAVVSVIEPVLAARGLELVEVEVRGGGRARTLRVVVDREGGVDLDGLTAASEVISPLLDSIAAAPSGSYTLEVTSPGLERPLRRPDQFRRAVGETIVVKTAELEPRRHRGTLATADDNGIEITVDGETTHLAYDEIREARTVFEWGSQPKPRRQAKPRRGSQKASRT